MEKRKVDISRAEMRKSRLTRYRKGKLLQGIVSQELPQKVYTHRNLALKRKEVTALKKTGKGFKQSLGYRGRVQTAERMIDL